MDVAPSSPGIVHVADLAGSAQTAGRAWTATTTIRVVDGGGDPVAGATVNGVRREGNTASCITGAAGTCSAHRTVSLVATEWTVQGVSAAQSDYDPRRNTDADGASNGTVIRINKP